MPIVLEAARLKAMEVQLAAIAAAIGAQPGGTIVHIADVLQGILEGSGVSIDRSVPNQITISATGTAAPPVFQPTTLPATAVSFSDTRFKSASTDAVPATAKHILVDIPLMGTVVWVANTKFRGKNPAAVGGVRSGANATPLDLVDIYRGKEVRFWLGRTVGYVPLCAYDRGRAGLAAEHVSISYV